MPWVAPLVGIATSIVGEIQGAAARKKQEKERAAAIAENDRQRYISTVGNIYSHGKLGDRDWSRDVPGVTPKDTSSNMLGAALQGAGALFGGGGGVSADDREDGTSKAQEAIEQLGASAGRDVDPGLVSSSAPLRIGDSAQLEQPGLIRDTPQPEQWSQGLSLGGYDPDDDKWKRGIRL